MRALPTLALAACLVFASGCFVFDELDKGRDYIDAHSPKAKKEAAAKAKAEAQGKGNGEKPPTYQQLVQSWWKDAKTLSLSPDEREQSDDPMVPCQHAGRTVYTKRSECIARGGRPG